MSEKQTDIMLPENSVEIGETVKEILSPVLAAMATFMQHSTEALERIAAQQKMQSDRMEALEKQMRLNTLVTPVQVRYFNDAMRQRARRLLEKYALQDNGAAVKKLSALIRKSVLSRYGVGALHDIPRYEYNVVISQIDTWNDMLAVMDCKRACEGKR